MPQSNRDPEPAEFDPSVIIAKKRDGGTLTPQEIAQFIARYVSAEIPDYQMAAMAMAICIRGMDAPETAALTKWMLNSGTTLQWTSSAAMTVDKHSTGGIGDKVSLVLTPLLACCGLKVPMLLGRGLGPTGGTLDKMESIPGFRTDLSIGEIQDVTQRVGCVITGTTEELVPADRKLYALRDATATVPSIPLITASIMSKKLAEKLDALVLDVKFGNGAFMKTIEAARELAVSMVEIGQEMGLKTRALLTDMNKPLGRMVGNAVEVNESVAALAGQGPDDLMELVMALGRELLLLTGLAQTDDDALGFLQKQLKSGRALEKFREMVAAQGGDLDAPREVAPASEIKSNRSGYIKSIDAEKLGRTIIQMGGGRRTVLDAIDHTVGLEMLVELGQEVEQDQSIIRVFAPKVAAKLIEKQLKEAIIVDEHPAPATPLVRERIVSDPKKTE